MKFTGERGENIEIFLDGVEECWALARLTETKILKALPELFEDIAATWIRSNHQHWNTWTGFCNAIRRWCSMNSRAQQRLAQEVIMRTQGPEEPVRTYATCLDALMLCMEPTPSLELQLDMLHRNMKPRLQQLVRRGEFEDMGTCLDFSIEAELSLEAEKFYRPPRPPENCNNGPINRDKAIERVTKMIVASLQRMSVTPGQTATQTPSKLPTDAKSDAGTRTAGPRKKTGSSHKHKRHSRRSKPSSSSSDLAGDERRTRKKDKAGESKPPMLSLISCFGCGTSGVMRRDCPKCQGNDRQAR